MWWSPAFPTHFAVALSYVEGEMVAPTVVAKGADEVAFRIRELRTRTLCRSSRTSRSRVLFDAVEIDEQVPPEHYKAVAGVISLRLPPEGKDGVAFTIAGARTVWGCAPAFWSRLMSDALAWLVGLAGAAAIYCGPSFSGGVLHTRWSRRTSWLAWTTLRGRRKTC